MDDSELLNAYVDGDEAAFGEFLRRYVDLVYSTALRRLNGDAFGAEEVTQTVFLLAARKARALENHPALPGWLYRTAWQTAEKARRSDLRRQVREWEAAQMNTGDEGESLWQQTLPFLDQAMQELSEPERFTILLRFFLRKSMREVASALGISEAAAKMRVSRAVDQLRGSFARRGVLCSAVLLSAILEKNAVQAAPSALLTGISASISQIAPTGIVASYAAKALLFMTYTKPVKIGIAAVLLALLGVGVYEFAVSSNRQTREATNRAPESDADSATNARAVNGSGTAGQIRSVGASASTAAAVEKLRGALALHLPKSGISWPCEEVIQAVEAIGDKKAVFEALKGAIAHPEDLFTGNLGVADPEAMVRGRAINAMRNLGSDVPEVKPYLWELYESKTDAPQALEAIMVLKAFGLTSADLPKMIDGLPGVIASPAGRRLVPEAIADVIAADPQGSAPAVAALQGLLSSADDDLRFSAACALATSHLDDPRVSKSLADPLTNFDASMTRNSVEALGKAGPKAAAFVPALLELANNTTDEYLRKDILRAVAAIQPDDSAKNPDIARVVATDTTERDLGEKLQNGGASIDDLMAALRVPRYATLAAARIGELGSFGSQAVPLMREALNGRDEDARDQIVRAIQKVAPDTKIERVDAKAMTEAIMGTEISLGARGNNYEDPVTKLVMERRAFSTWWTREEVISFAKRLNALEPGVARTFVSNVTERDPSMKEYLAKVGE